MYNKLRQAQVRCSLCHTTGLVRQ
ncbi:MAG: hypothetical protein KBG30_05625 [Bacteroidales bacterium]|nr:hypothetical protein [Bacteroidales bacterium]